MEGFRHLGHGLGLRTVHYRDAAEGTPDVDWFEIISENFMVQGGNPRRVLRAVSDHYPVVMHGVSMSIGSVDPLSQKYLRDLRALADEVEPEWISDHLCWSSFGGHSGHDLWPLPYTEEALAHVVERVVHVQERLRRRILVENVSSYVAYESSSLTEWEFLSELAQRADCGLLLDVNNIYVSARNHGFNPREFLAGIPPRRVGQIHLAGHSDHGTHLLDTHDAPVCDEVWALYADAVRLIGPVSTLIEWDDQLPPMERLLEETRRAASVERDACTRPAKTHASAT